MRLEYNSLVVVKLHVRLRMSVMVNKFYAKGFIIDGNISDSVDTPSVMKHMRDLVGACNVYCSESSVPPNSRLLETIALYCTRMLQIFGVIPSESKIGYPVEGKVAGQHVDVEATVVPFATIIANFREEVRTVALEEKCELLTVHRKDTGYVHLLCSSYITITLQIYYGCDLCMGVRK